MRSTIAAAVLSLAFAAPAPAQTAPAAAVPPAGAGACERRQANLGGVGRASVVAFTGAIFGDRVCATVANLSLDGVTARISDTPPAAALAVAPLASGMGAMLVLSGDALSVVPAGAALPSSNVTAAGNVPPPAGGASAAVGPFVVAPGGQIPNFGGDTRAEPRIVLAYAGQRLLLIGTSPVTLVDLARALRDQPDLFGADAVERAVVLARGTEASLALNPAEGAFGTASQAARYLTLSKR
ncbi:MAG: hypothetical protein QOI11_1944 [Candidatus Eremiobacteraeota bacterium]|jgi:hypothetical protein|nr:hypothetical protein [Candidatus Eremiobacteraeota bacterium]